MEDVSPAHSSQHQIGCAELPPGMSRSKYFEKLSLLETSAFFDRTPSAHTLDKWNKNNPNNARYSVLAPSALSHGTQDNGAFPATSSSRELTDALAKSCKILQAEAVIFRTPASFTPSASNRDRIRRFFGEIATKERFGDTVFVWSPEGLWQPSSIRDASKNLDLLIAVDPLAQDPLEENKRFVEEQLSHGTAYLRVNGIGHSRRRYESYELEIIAEIVSVLNRSWIVFAHTGKYPDALSMARTLGSTSNQTNSMNK